MCFPTVFVCILESASKVTYDGCLQHVLGFAREAKRETTMIRRQGKWIGWGTASEKDIEPQHPPGPDLASRVLLTKALELDMGEKNQVLQAWYALALRGPCLQSW